MIPWVRCPGKRKMEQRMYGMSTLTWLVNQGCALRKIKENPCHCSKPVEFYDLSEKTNIF